MSRIRKLLPFLALLAISLSARAAELTVFAAASLQDALTEIGAAYQKQTSEKVVFNFGASSTLARQIDEGAPADVFLSADEAKVDALAQKDLLLAGTRRALLTNTLVVVVPSSAAVVPHSISDLARRDIQRIALAEPATVPAGIYAREYLEKMGLWPAIEPKVVPTENVRAALAAVASGNVEVGMVYKTDALISPKVKVALEIPAREGPAISYPVVVLKRTARPERAKNFAAYLGAPAARAVFEKFGFGLVK